MRLREVLHSVKALKIHLIDQLSGEVQTIDSTEPGSLRTVQRFLHCEIVSVEPEGQDVKIVVI